MVKKLSFEESLSQLEEIVKKLESGECTLDESIELYSSGAKLAAECSKLLDNAKLTLKTLADAEGDANV